MNSCSGIRAGYKNFVALLLLLSASVGFGQSYNDISLHQAATPSIASIGDTLTFSIQIFNEGQSDLTNLSVKTQFPASITFDSYTAFQNTFFDFNTGIWTIGNEMSQSVNSMILQVKAIALQEGIVYALAQVNTLNEVDIDSEAGNDFLPEDDMMAACVSIPHQICTAIGESVTLTAPIGYVGYEWYFDDGNGTTLVATEATYIATQPGSYTFSVLGSSCPQGLCCPVILEENCQSNQPPIAWWDEVTTPPGTTVDINILNNDTDPDDGIDTSSISIVSPPANGTATINPDGTIHYTPDQGFAGQDTLIYEICDNGMPAPILCDTALVVITVGEFFFDLALEKSLAPNQALQVDLGDEVSYILTVINEGDFAATNIEITDHIPQGLILSSNNNGWVLNSIGDAVFIINEVLQPGEIYEVEINLTVVYGASGQSILNIGEVTGASDGNGITGLDIDSTPNNGNVDEDDTDGQIIEIVPHDPTGYIYCDKTGIIITGGTISVDGPGQVFIIKDGLDGYYEFFTDGTPGTYNLTYNHPDGLIMSTACLPSGTFDPTGLGSQVTLGAGANASGTYLSDHSCAVNPFYMTFELEPGDPPVFNNNLPFQCSYIGSFVCEDEGNGVQDGTEPGMQGIIVNLFNCADTLNPLMTTVTGLNGNYAFDGLIAGDYMVQFELPTNSRFAEGAAVNKFGFSDCIVLGLGECDTTTSACILACPSVNAGPDLEICQGEQVQIQAFLPYGNGDITWTPITGLSDPTVLQHFANPLISTNYIVTYNDGLGCQSVDSIFIDVTTGCLEDLLVEDTVVVQANCEFGDPLFCFDIPYEELSNYSFKLNGQPYDAEFGPCDYLRARYYAIGALASLGNRQLRLDRWSVNGQVHTGMFQNLEEMLSQIAQWDPAGDWGYEPTTGSLKGGSRQGFYSSIDVTDMVVGTVYSFTLYQFYAPNSSYVILPEGENDLVITRLNDGVTDTVHIRAFCVTPDFVEMTMPVGNTDTLCFDLSELGAEVNAIFNPCLSGIDNAAEFEVMNGEECLTVFAMLPGETEACYVVCDEIGVCDTTYILVSVYDEDLQLIPDSLCTPKDIPIVGEVLLNDHINGEVVSVGVIVPPDHGTVLVNPDNTITYIPDEGYCNDKDGEPLDQFTYEVCTQFDCETTIVTVQVKCDGLIVYNGFSPNGDGVNDTFKIDGLKAYDSHKLMVFNRWGNKVMQSENYNNDWDGYWDAKRLPVGTYFYLIELNGGETWLSGYLQIWW